MSLSPNVWFPAVTGLGGLLIGAFVQVGTRWIDRKQAAEDREERRTEARADFQRATLLDLQDALIAVYVRIGELALAGEEDTSEKNAAWQRLWEAKAGADRLRVRVADDTLRTLVANYLGLAEHSKPFDEEAVPRLRDALDNANERAGALIRER